MPYKDREKLLAWRATPEFRKRNYAHVKAWRARPENKPKRAEEARKWREKHPELFKEIHDRHRANHIEEIRVRDREAQKRYRLTPQYKAAQQVRNLRFKAKQREEQMALAGRPKPDKCEICQTDEFRIVFDHCHKEGHFRGWICDRCNRTLGLVRDDPNLLLALAGYLKK
jgi:Recombination endonuclease VII